MYIWFLWYGYSLLGTGALDVAYTFPSTVILLSIHVLYHQISDLPRLSMRGNASWIALGHCIFNDVLRRISARWACVID
jgi:hypothetical protein